ncbi:MAG: septum site-determining protein MinC [Anaerolineales bacterium]
MTDNIIIKGISQGVLVTLQDAEPWDDALVALAQRIEQQPAFFKGAQIVLDAKTRELTNDDLDTLRTQLDPWGIRLVGILSSNEPTCAVAAAQGLATNLADIEPPTRPTPPVDDVAAFDSEEYGTTGVLIKRTLRSGRTVRSRGHVVVIGDVNSGAEIIAVGDIIIWGKLRGTVHAGAQGDESAVVCALDLAPVQLRIAGLITIPPQGKRRNIQPEMAYVAGGQIEATPWTG